MIFIDNKSIREDDFKSLLESTKRICIEEVGSKKIEKMTGVEFEGLAYKSMAFAAKGTSFDGDVVQTGPQTFPDIIAKKFFGTEVKTTTDDKWLSTGNSVLETTRVEGVERIYMFFGKFGGTFDVKYRLYQDCLSDIGVTHSPRYKINMDLNLGESIFNKIGIDYDSLRQNDPIQKIKNYYRQNLREGEELWWIDPLSEVISSPVIRPFSKFSEEEKNNFVTEAMIFFPEIFGSSSLKFERLASYLVTQYNAVSSNIRDTFTAGGQVDVVVDNSSKKLPKILYHLQRHAKDIATKLPNIEASKLAYYWRTATVDNDRLAQWLSILDTYTCDSDVTNSGVFKSGLDISEKNKK